MLHLTFVIADCVLIADWQDDPAGWVVTIQDSLTGKVYNNVWGNKQFSAVMYLIVAGDDGELSKEMYEQVGGLFDNCPTECRLIP